MKRSIRKPGTPPQKQRCMERYSATTCLDLSKPATWLPLVPDTVILLARQRYTSSTTPTESSDRRRALGRSQCSTSCGFHSRALRFPDASEPKAAKPTTRPSLLREAQERLFRSLG